MDENLEFHIKVTYCTVSSTFFSLSLYICITCTVQVKAMNFCWPCIYAAATLIMASIIDKNFCLHWIGVKGDNNFVKPNVYKDLTHGKFAA